MNSPAVDIAQYISNSGSSYLGLELATDLFVSKMPDSPDACVTLYDTGGIAPQSNYAYYRPTVMAHMRGAQGGYQAAYAVGLEILEFIRSIQNETINGTRYIQV